MRASFVFLAVFIITILLLGTSYFTVDQYETAIVLRLGKILNQPESPKSNDQVYIAGPGLHFRWPFIDTVDSFDMRVHTLESDSDRVMTSEQKEVAVNAYVKWRIANPVIYYKSTASNQTLATALLQQTLQDAMRSQFGQMTISDLVNTKREQVMDSLLKALQAPAQQLGIEIIDVRITKLELPQKVEESIFARMRSKRENDAATYRADGMQAAEQIKADADAQAAVIIATAKSEAAKVRAEGSADAAQISAKAYDQDPDFYAFYRSMIAYQAIFANQHATLVLRPEGLFFQNFNPVGVSNG